MVEKKHYGTIILITIGIVWSVITIGLYIFSLVLYMILNFHDDTSVMKDLLLTYCILQAISLLVTMLNIKCSFSTLIFSQYNVVKVVTFLLNLPMVVATIVVLIITVSEIVIAGHISYNFFSFPL